MILWMLKSRKNEDFIIYGKNDIMNYLDCEDIKKAMKYLEASGSLLYIERKEISSDIFEDIIHILKEYDIGEFTRADGFSLIKKLLIQKGDVMTGEY